VFTAVVPIKEITAKAAASGAGPPAAASWNTAAVATLHCLTGCAIGEILGMVIGAAASVPNIATVVLAVALAFVFGYALTARALLRAGAGLQAALRAALAADTASIAVMELTDNTVIAAIPGALDAGLGTALFWASLAFSLIVAFFATVPLNRWLIGRGKGHALCTPSTTDLEVLGRGGGEPNQARERKRRSSWARSAPAVALPS
jgi:uncharacterized protein DUF4396